MKKLTFDVLFIGQVWKVT